VNPETVLQKLQKVTKTGPGKWQALCPVHDDKNPSLSIWTNGSGRLFFKCFAGCHYRDIEKVLGIEPKGRACKAFWDYPQADEVSLREFFKAKEISGEPNWLTANDVRLVQLKAGKQLRFLGYTSPDAAKPIGCIRAMADGSPVQTKNGPQKYPVLGKAGLLGIKQAVKSDTIYIVEGLRDWLTAKAIGYPAVTGITGASTFKQEWIPLFAGKKIVIIFDCDKAGVEGSRKAATMLYGTAKEIRIVELPYTLQEKHGNDLHDFIVRDKNSRELLDELIKATLIFEPSPEEQKELNKHRQTYPYAFCDDGIYILKDEHKIKLANFTGRIILSALHDDGLAAERHFTVEVVSRGTRRIAEMQATRFPDMRWIADIGHNFIIQPGSTSKDHCRAAIQLNSLDAAEKTIYTHTGWRKINGQSVYLTGNGAVGENGWMDNVSVKLSTDLAYSLSIPNKADLSKSIQASLDFLQAADITITLPMFCAAYRSVLGNCDYSISLVGKTGTGKTVCAALAQQHFGRAMSYMTVPANWSSTANSLEIIAFTAKDALLLVDDFSSQGYSDKAERLLRAQGNSSARQRLNSDSTLKLAKPPRGLIISTGEDLPQIQSVLARCQIIEIEADMVDWEAVSQSQQAAAAGLFEAAMGGYIRWLAANRITDLQKSLLSQVHDVRLEFSSRGYTHKRTGTIVANQFIGFKTFLDFALDAEAIESSKYENLLTTCYDVLGELGSKQTQIQNESNPATRFIEAIQSAISSGKAHLAAPDGNSPLNASAFGWRSSIYGASEEWQAYGERIGWVSGDEVLLDPTASYKVSQDMLQGKLGISSRGLRKLLVSDGLVIPEISRGTNTVRRNLNGSQRNVLLLRKDVFSQEEQKEFDYSQADEGEVPF